MQAVEVYRAPDPRDRPVAYVAWTGYRVVLASLAAMVAGPAVVWLLCAAVAALGLPVYLFAPRLGLLAVRFLWSLGAMAFLETARDNAVMCFLFLPPAYLALRDRARDRRVIVPLAGALAALALALHGGGGGGTALMAVLGGLAAGHAFQLALDGTVRRVPETLP